jgi:hypothetical protein
MKIEKIANKLFYERYKNRLLEAISEVDVMDDRGNIIISKDLKVRHMDSGFEYTIEDVIDDNGNISVVLRDPAAPRIEDPPGDETLLGAPPSSDFLHEDDDEKVEEETIFVIDQSEFEKEYEIK